MAKKKTAAKNIKSECCGTPIGDYKPSLYLSLEGKDVSEIEGLKVGEEVQVLVTGKITRLTQEKRKKYGTEKEVESGTIDIEGYTVAVVEDEKNEFVKMADDDTNDT